jgi:hypothetical protein
MLGWIGISVQWSEPLTLETEDFAAYNLNSLALEALKIRHPEETHLTPGLDTYDSPHFERLQSLCSPSLTIYIETENPRE